MNMVSDRKRKEDKLCWAAGLLIIVSLRYMEGVP